MAYTGAKRGRKTNEERERLARQDKLNEMLDAMVQQDPAENIPPEVWDQLPEPTINLGIYKTHPDIQDPIYGTKESACFDLRFDPAGKTQYTVITAQGKSITREFSKGSAVINPKEVLFLPTGLIFDVPHGYSLRVFSRSGTASKRGLVMINGVGVVDHDYTGECSLLVYNAKDTQQTIESGERLAQAELIPILKLSFQKLDTPPAQKTDRVGGFGSTGVK